mgnify:CR=1 FL=1
MNLSHTDLTNLTDGASLRPRLSASPSVLSRMVHTSASDVCFREIREICVRQKSSDERKLSEIRKREQKVKNNQVCNLTRLLSV